MYRKISGKTLGKLRIFGNILNSWINNNIRCVDAWNGKDVPWWYNERALLSIFAGAVWRQKGIAFEEFSAPKKWRWRKGAQVKLYPGRQDISIKLGKYEFVGEAKDDWSGIMSKSPAGNIKRGMICACKDIKKSPWGGRRKIALLFVRPYVKRKHLKSIDKLIAIWLKRVKKDVDYSCCAWIFPAVSRTFFGKDGNIYPGIMLFIKEV